MDDVDDEDDEKTVEEDGAEKSGNSKSIKKTNPDSFDVKKKLDALKEFEVATRNISEPKNIENLLNSLQDLGVNTFKLTEQNSISSNGDDSDYLEEED